MAYDVTNHKLYQNMEKSLTKVTESLDSLETYFCTLIGQIDKMTQELKELRLAVQSAEEVEHPHD